MSILHLLHFKPSPVMIVAMASVVVLAAFVTMDYFKPSAKTVDPHVTMESNPGALSRSSVARRTVVPTLIEGEVACTADRIAEATALALSTSLHAASEQASGRLPRTVRELLAGVAARNLLPPGLTLTQTEGVLASIYGSLSVRYRPVPLGIEVVSIGSRPENGPALIVRVPDELSGKGEARLFIADRLAGVTVPAPFAASAEVIALGWSPERWRSLK